MDTIAAQELVEKTLQDSFDKERFVYLVKNMLNHIEKDTFTYQGKYIFADFADSIHQMERIGKYESPDEKIIDILIVHLKKDTSLERARTKQRNFVAKYLNGSRGGVLKDAALVAFVAPNGEDWRFSFVKMEYKFTEKGKVKEDFTPARRYSFLVGKNENSHTAQSRLLPVLLNDEVNPTLEELGEIFSVERVNKEFYTALKEWYDRTRNQVEFPNEESITTDAHTHKSVSLIRLLTRLLFVWFIKEKDLVNTCLFDYDKLQEIIHWNKGSSYYKAILQNLFFATLNHEITDRSFCTSNSHFVTNVFRYQQGSDTPLFKISNTEIEALFEKTPFLNGGLFECLDRELTEAEKAQHPERQQKSGLRIDEFSSHPNNPLSVPNNLFFDKSNSTLGLINLLQRYQFTIEESTPMDIAVALDPELLGKVFENLLATYNPETHSAANEATGSYYTPREIVNYMVDESLKTHFRQVCGLDDAELETLFAEDDCTGGKELSDNCKDAIIKAMSEIKILDPAVGSGAFPMGILQRMVDLLAKADPDNNKWKAQQIKELPELASVEQDLKTASEISDTQARNKAEKELEKRRQEIETLFGEQDQNYLRKLYLIQKCIYGVDIQPIACQIAKLRFFISLAIEQTVTKNKQYNYGIKPLPNLETKFIAADSLMGLDTPQQYSVHNLEIEEKEKQLAQVRAKHFTAKTLQTKKKYRTADQSLRNEIAELLKDDGWGDKSAQRIVGWDPYSQDTVAEWFDAEQMFGIKGFDVVMGNPPYIQLQNEGGRLADRYKDQEYKTFARSGDIYQLFYEQGHQQLNDEGYLCFITSNKWMRAGYGKESRRYFSTQTQPIKLLDIGPDVFDATVDTNILLFGKTPQNNPAMAAAVREENGVEVDLHAIPLQEFPISKDGSAWTILSPLERQLKDKIDAIGTRLKDWDISINYGIKTGYNQAFIIDNATKCALIAEDPKSAEILKPILRGRDIQRYQAKWAEWWLIATHNGYGNVPPIDIGDYPAVKRHLDQFYPQLQTRQDQGNTPYNLRSCAYQAEFEKEKIVWGNLSVKPRFAVDIDAHYLSAPTNMLTGNHIKYIAGFLNSQFCYYSMRKLAYSRAQGYMEYKKIFVEQIPIPKITDANRKLANQIETHVTKILTTKATKATNPTNPTAEQETEIDRLVYKLYALTAEEIKIIEND